ncbi:cytochrome c551 [Virgibacillus alimentarius]|uniref:Cytochrome c551 n=1 Tax=Virgibacillus alimentarius TaxID=698769 RepID=A0ABS4S5M9_9BACI|nr:MULTISPECIES: cytochrome c [Virgibacillus]MBP2256802.1 cytochrome c551 [Virgibacillus alimentarius]HLR65671.1 cytochrome c [Virgibacillus sp.]
MKKWLLAILFGSALVLGACGGGNDNANDEPEDNATEETEENGAEEEGGTVDTAAAEEIFESNCASCHGADLSGGAGPDLTKAGADHSADEIKDIIQNGKGSMPAQQVSEDDATTLADWLAEKK